ncbi:MAG: SPOR domain-containing protein [Gammaproteobacteria bacterium]|jgi:cell division protein FtsN
MARDYKHRANRRRSRQGAPGWLWLVTGLLAGLFVAFLVYLKSQPSTASHRSARTTLTAPLPHPIDQDARSVHKTTPVKIPPPPKPKFDFYTILPEQEVVVPDQDITGSTRKGVRQVEQPGKYLLQVGSFQSHKQADELKAKLALLGLEASIQTVTINNNETWNRVRIGPYTNLGTLNDARARLNAHHIKAILLKLKG